MKRSYESAMQAEEEGLPVVSEKGDGSNMKRSPLFREDLLRKIGRYASIESLVQMHRTCHKFHAVLNAPDFMESYISNQNGMDERIQTLGQLELMQRMERHGLLAENRIGFAFASLEISEDQRSIESEDERSVRIEGSQSRLVQLQAVADVFSEATIIIESHCGRAGPRRVAPVFSQERGHTVAQEFEHLDNTIEIHSWGRNIADVAQSSEHPYSELAQTGKGWVEVYLQLDGVAFPEHPSYYEGIEVAIDPAETFAQSLR